MPEVIANAQTLRLITVPNPQQTVPITKHLRCSTTIQYQEESVRAHSKNCVRAGRIIKCKNSPIKPQNCSSTISVLVTSICNRWQRWLLSLLPLHSWHAVLSYKMTRGNKAKHKMWLGLSQTYRRLSISCRKTSY